MKKKSESSKGSGSRNTGVHTPEPPQDMDPSKRPEKGKTVIGDKKQKPAPKKP